MIAVQLSGQVAGAAASTSAGASKESAASPFVGALASALKESENLDRKAQDAVTGLLDGSGVEVHDAMIAVQKSDLAFQLALQVRNKAVSAYQQMMQMQF